MSESAIDRGSDVEDGCALCLEPLPPFWDMERRVSLICCGKEICKDCSDKGSEYLDKAAAEGSYGKAEEQLDRCCPLCRTRKPPNPDGARKMMQDKLEEGRLPLHLYRALGILYLDGDEGLEVDVVRGMEILMLGAERGEPNGQYSLGVRYLYGKDGLSKSRKDAKRWLSAATEQGHAMAEYELAYMSKDEGNDAEFLQHLSGSASKGYDDACYDLGEAHYNGEYGLQQSFEEAIRVLMPATDRGHTESMKLLGYVMCCPINGRMEPHPWDNPNFTRGMHWVRRAAEDGDEDATSYLGELGEAASSTCFRCYKEAPSEKAFLRCSRCRAAWYCSKDCQVQHWKAKEGGHKHVCIKWT